MKIRSITGFYHPGEPDAGRQLDNLAGLAQKAAQQFTSAGFEVQTTRLATVPFPLLLSEIHAQEAVDLAVRLEAQASDRGFQYISLGPALPSYPGSFELIPEMLTHTSTVFASGSIADAHRGVDMAAVKASAEVIVQAITLEPDGFANLRFAALARVAPFTPFFPAAFSEGATPAFGLAIEAADAAVEAFDGAKTIQTAADRLVKRIESSARTLEDIAQNLASEYNLFFKGFDFSLAPFPTDACSLGGALERLGVAAVGQSGSLAAAAIVADTLDRGEWRRTGFNGLMLPVLEDSVLARRSIEGTLTLKDLLMYAAVCGCGLDTVPLPGEITAEQIQTILADVAALAVRLSKPLTARLMPIPGKTAGERTSFDFEYFENGSVMALDASALGLPLAASQVIPLHPRRQA
jgi:uncharacterized protein (UPF0210 family)